MSFFTIPPTVALGDDLAVHLTTPFEDWCESQGIHPEAFGAWEGFEAHRSSPTRAAG
ncbi:hypothetical protein [Nocardioides sp. LS1]|uniref:hypothetical protein n=1 Tax=Nocardioides sp. LS1 TaxID=1027620 RepID=UPI000FF9D8B0|nr:hypothetical protein [Nocardioides sp. LS1]GCD90682.1 hypothetical protein NLS1_26880 [Nocardioides sp. LS1]